MRNRSVVTALPAVQEHSGGRWAVRVHASHHRQRLVFFRQVGRDAVEALNEFITSIL
jgi:hypothetical protein